MNNNRPTTVPSVLVPLLTTTPSSTTFGNLSSYSILDSRHQHEDSNQNSAKDIRTDRAMAMSSRVSQPVSPLSQPVMKSEGRTTRTGSINSVKENASETLYKGIICNDDDLFSKALHQATKTLSSAEVFSTILNAQQTRSVVITTRRKEYISYAIDIFLALNVNIIGPHLYFVFTQGSDINSISQLGKEVIDEAKKLVYMSVVFDVRTTPVQTLSWTFFCESTKMKNNEEQKIHTALISSLGENIEELKTNISSQSQSYLKMQTKTTEENPT